jgi:hypothetical protein
VAQAGEPLEPLEQALRTQVHVGARERLRATACAAHSAVEVVQQDPLVLRAGGRLVCSGSDPLTEAQRWVERQDLQPKDIVVVFGAGAGHHLALLQKRCASVLVIEPDGELLATLLRRGPLPVDEVSDQLHRVCPWVSSQLTVGSRAQYLTWPAARRRYPQQHAAVEAFLQDAVRQATITLRTLRKRASVWVEHLLENMPRSRGSVLAQGLGTWLAGRPAIIVAAGPSLADNIQELARVEGRAAIIAVNTALGALEQAGIRADMVVVLEALDVSEQLEGHVINRDIPRVLSICANPALFRTDAPVLPFVENMSLHGRVCAAAGFEMVPAGGSVANAALSVVRAIGASQAIMVGQDLAYRDDRVYAPGTVFDSMRVDVDADAGTANFSGLDAKQRIARSRPEVAEDYASGSVLRTVAWGGEGQVVTTPSFEYFRLIFEAWARLEPNVRLINATEGGARIEGFEERRLAAVIDELPAATPGRWPTAPVLTSEVVIAALEAEAHAVSEVQAVATALSASGDDHCDELARELGQRVEDCGLLHAHCWATLFDVISNDHETPQGLGRRVLACSAVLEGQLMRAIERCSTEKTTAGEKKSKVRLRAAVVNSKT